MSKQLCLAAICLLLVGFSTCDPSPSESISSKNVVEKSEAVVVENEAEGAGPSLVRKERQMGGYGGCGSCGSHLDCADCGGGGWSCYDGECVEAIPRPDCAYPCNSNADCPCGGGWLCYGGKCTLRRGGRWWWG